MMIDNIDTIDVFIYDDDDDDNNFMRNIRFDRISQLFPFLCDFENQSL